MKMYAQITKDGTAISETAVCADHLGQAFKYGASDSTGALVDASGNDALSCMECGAAPTRYGWTDWEAETELGNDDDREGVYYLTITDHGEEMAVIIHRVVGGEYPLNGPVAMKKVERAKRIVAALNDADEGAEPEPYDPHHGDKHRFYEEN